ncbi:hypothetical protein Tco_1029330 [Tanacetum coccineum]|uniref:Uncharacterized protein n=1 Tax=Tanacetum coccineum TaxID=301880 RepID=A0ABQ5G352_9ASTR
MDNPNITIEEYIRFEEEKARRHSQTFNWQTVTFEKVENYEDEDDCSIDFETEFSAIVFDNTLTTIPSKHTVCPPNENKVDFRISLEESNDEDYTVIFDENSFSYKIIYVNNLKTDSENDNIPSSPNTTVDYLDDLDYFKDFENEFPAIVYNDGLTSKSDLEINPLVSFERIDKFNLIDEASLSEYAEKIVSCFNDLFNIIHPDDSKSEKDNDDNDIGIIQSLEDNEITHGKNGLSKTSHDKTIRTFETGNAKIWHHYQLLIRDTHGSDTKFRSTLRRLGVVTSRGSRRCGADWLTGVAVDVRESCLEETIWDSSTFGPRVYSGACQYLYDELYRDGIGCCGYDVFSVGRGQAPEKVTGVDLFYLHSMDHGTTNIPHLLAQYLFRHAEGRKSRARLLGGHFIGRLAMHFGLVSDEGLRGLQGPERQQAATAGAHEAPPPPLPAPQHRTMSQRIKRVEEEVHNLRRDVVGLQGVVKSFTTEQSRVSTWLITCMTQIMDVIGQTYQPFDSTLVGSSRLSFQRCVRPRTSDASTFAAPHTNAQPDP